MSWLLLEGHQQFVSAWQLISGISEISCVDFQKAAHLFVRLNERDPIDGTHPIPFYAHNKFDGYFPASEAETDLCINALRQAVLFGTVSFFDGNTEINKPLEEGYKNDVGLSFFLRKQDVVKSIQFKSIEISADIPMPTCLKENLLKEEVKVRESPKTENHKAKLIKSLLYLNYKDKELLDNPRRFFDDVNSDISKDFRALELSLPSGKTIEKWLKNVDLDID